MSELIRYAIIGAGAMGQEHIRYLHMLEHAQVSVIADPNQAMRETALGLTGGNARGFTDYRELLNADLADAYIIATPNYTHIDVISDLIAQGKPLLVEKPLCTTVADCWKVMAMAETTGTPVWVAMEYRYMPPVAKLIAQIRNGDIGNLHMLTIREHRRPFLQKVGDWNRFAQNTGGTLVEKCCHFFDLMRLITGSEAVRVFASGGQDVNHLDEVYDGKTPDIIDNAFVTIDFASGQRAMLELSMFAEGAHYEQTITAVGDKARLETRVPRPLQHEPLSVRRPATLITAQRSTGEESIEEFSLADELLDAGAHFGSTYYEHLGFFDVVRGISTPQVTLSDGLAAVAIGAAAEHSIRESRVIML